jgi:hypothetical protein
LSHPFHLHFLSFLLLLILLFSTAAFAEPPQGLGFHAGLNLADVSTTGTTQTGTMTGFLVGATYEREFAPNFFFVPGGQLIQRGFSQQVATREVDLKMTYLEFPVLFQARFQGADVIPFFTGGPVVGLKMGTSCSVSGGTCTVVDDSAVKSLHMGIEIGGGTLFPLENGSYLSAQLRYHLGMTKVTGSTSEPHHRGLIAQFGYLF